MTTMPLDNRASYERSPVPWPAGIKGAAVLDRLSGLSPIIVGAEPAALAVMADEALRPPYIAYADDDFIKDADRQVWDETVKKKEKLIRALLRLATKHADLAEPAPAWMADLDPTFIAAQRLVDSEEGARRLTEALDTLLRVKPARRPSGRGRPPVQDPYYVIVRVAVWHRFNQQLPISDKWKTTRKPGAPKGSRRSNDEVDPGCETTVLICELVDAFGIQRDNVALRGVLRRYLDELKRERREPRRDDGSLIVLTD